mgnify:FL=1
MIKDIMDNIISERKSKNIEDDYANMRGVSIKKNTAKKPDS